MEKELLSGLINFDEIWSRVGTKPPEAPAQPQPIQTKPIQTQPIQTQPIQTKPIETQPIQAKPIETQPIQTQPIQAKPIETQPIQTQPIQAKPIETQPIQTQPIQAKPIETQPIQTQPIQIRSIQIQPIQIQPIQMTRPMPPRPPAKPKPTDVSVLEGFMDDEARDADFYCRLAKKLCGNARNNVLEVACDEKRHMRMLQLEYFLLTGDSYAPDFEPVEIRGVLTALRHAYIEEKKGEEAYLKAAAETSNPDLRAVYTEIAADEAEHAALMRALIACTMA